MNQKAYKTRVEISVVVEIDVAAASEDDAGFEAEETADQLVAEIEQLVGEILPVTSQKHFVILVGLLVPKQFAFHHETQIRHGTLQILLLAGRG